MNINADTAAGAVAEALRADYFLLLTDIAGTHTYIHIYLFTHVRVDITNSTGMHVTYIMLFMFVEIN